MQKYNPIKNSGSLVISLDYELLWGIIEKSDVQVYAESNVKHVPDVIDRMLVLFEKYEVKVTFAIVGMLMCNNKKEILDNQPQIKPTYNNSALSPYGAYLEGVPFSDSPLYYGANSLQKLMSSASVEIGTHTFCHFYCWEEGQTIKQFEEDLKTAIKVAANKGITLKSIVFPRNQVNNSYLKICRKYGITSYRGNAISLYNKTNNLLTTLFYRICRFIDSYIELIHGTTYSKDLIKSQKGLPCNIPASRIFRPYSKKLSLFEPMKIRRIKKEILYAAKHGEIYHLWWHPHNFGANIDNNMSNLEEVLKFYLDCKKKYGMTSYSMNELANIINEENE